MEKAGSWKDFTKAELHFSIVSHCCLSYCESTLKSVFREDNFLLYTLIVLLKTEAKFLIICSLFIMDLHGETVFFWIFFFFLVPQSLCHKKINLGPYWPCSLFRKPGIWNSVRLTPKWVFIFNCFSVVQKFILALLLKQDCYFIPSK